MESPTAPADEADRSPGSAQWSTRARAAVLLALLAAFCVALVIAERHDAPTADEPLHLTRGLAYLQTGDPHLSYAHPPLANVVTALPALAHRANLRVVQARGHAQGDVLSVATHYFKTDYENARAQLRSARAAMICWSLGLLAIVWVSVRSRFGDRAAAFAGLFVASHPVLIAHGHLMTTDLPLAFAGWLALWSAWELLDRPGRLPVLAFAGACALLVQVKHTGVGLCVLLSLAVVSAALLDLAPRWRGRSRRQRTLAAIGVVAAAATTTVILLDLAYGFHGVGMTVEQILGEPERRNWITKASKTQILGEHHPLTRLPRWLPVPLPYDWIFGVSMVGRQDEMGHGSFFFGDSRVGHWGYFPALILLKTPLALMLLAAVGAPWLIVGRRRLTRDARAHDSHVVFVIAAVTLGFVALALSSRIHIGVRHVIVVFVPLCVLSAVVVDRVLDASVRHWIRVVAMSLAMLSALEGWSHVRDPLAAFNVAAGGRAGGTRISLIGEDWGQHVDDLAAWARAHPDRPLHYRTSFPLRRLELRLWGVEAVPVRCADSRARSARYIAVHKVDAWRLRKGCLRWLLARPELKVATVEDHIDIYRWP